jgi:propanol-preferring alcohol dehydrogenase
VNEEYAGFEAITPRPCIAGHEGAGLIVAINDPASDLKIGDRVGIKYIIDTCNKCEDCLAGDEAVCPSFKCSIIHQPGTFQQL